jgi:hypothetical protein
LLSISERGVEDPYVIGLHDSFSRRRKKGDAYLLSLFDFYGVDERHHRPKACAHLLERLFLFSTPDRVELRTAVLVLFDPTLRECAVLNLGQGPLT